MWGRYKSHSRSPKLPAGRPNHASRRLNAAIGVTTAAIVLGIRINLRAVSVAKQSLPSPPRLPSRKRRRSRFRKQRPRPFLPVAAVPVTTGIPAAIPWDARQLMVAVPGGFVAAVFSPPQRQSRKRHRSPYRKQRLRLLPHLRRPAPEE